MKHVPLVLVATTLSIMTALPISFADDKLPAPAPAAEVDKHISWHAFMHELGSYPQVNASMSSDGSITLSGHVGDGIEKGRVESLARRVRDATELRSQLSTD